MKQSVRILIVKLTSMGDVVHVLPAISDIAQQRPDIIIDCLVEDSFVDIVANHPKVTKVIPAATRRWRTLTPSVLKSFFCFLRKLRQEQYDYIIDTQGLLKSAVLARLARIRPSGVRCGYAKQVLKEKVASYLYNKKIPIKREQHAITRIRSLVAHSLQITVDLSKVDYALRSSLLLNNELQKKLERASVLFAHGTTWQSKHLPEKHWESLIKIANEHGYQVVLTWGNDAEKARAKRLAKKCLATDTTNNNMDSILLVDKLSVPGLLSLIEKCDAIIAVDTGIGHLAAALNKPCISIYGSTDCALIGTMGQRQRHLQTPYSCSPCYLKQCDKLMNEASPCYQQITPQQIWQALALSKKSIGV